MSRVRMFCIGAALALFVYTGSTATDARVGTLVTAVQTALESEMEIEPGLIVDSPAAVGLLDIPVAVAFLLLLFGGLPLAVFGLLFERQWKDVAVERRPNLRVPYAVLIIQIVSMGLSTFALALLGEALLWALSEGMMVGASDWFLPAYFGAQILASIAVIPVWRRVLLKASDIRTGVLLLNRT